jgi:hypothetical protein
MYHFSKLNNFFFGKQRVSPPRGVLWITLNDTQILQYYII